MLNLDNVTNEKINNAPIEVTIKHTIDDITYTVKSRSSRDATQTLKDKLEAIIGREIAKMT